MSTSVHTLRITIRKMLKEAWNPQGRFFDTVTTSKEDEADLEKDEKKYNIKRGASQTDYSKTSQNAFESDIDELRDQPEFKSLEDFVTFKMDDEQSTYDATELQALARNIDYADRGVENALPPQNIINQIKTELNGYGLKFVPRETLKHFRGSMSSSHGTSPYKDFVSGGSGMGIDREGPVGWGIGSGIGAHRTKVQWDPNDPRNLSTTRSRKQR